MAGFEQTKPQYTTFRVSDYLGWQEDKSLILRPHFQRGAVWDPSDRSLLIDSVMRGFPIPLVVLQEEWDLKTGNATKRVVDGQQRLRTLISFVRPSLLEDRTEKDDFHYRPIGGRSSQRGIRFDDLTPQEQRHILTCSIPAVIIQADTSSAFVLEIYERLNSTGKRLTGQEMRYAKREGDFANIAYSLARANQTRWTDWRILGEKDVGRMLDVQLTSELLLLIMNGVQKTGKREIDAAYDGQSLSDEEANLLGAAFQNTMDSLATIYEQTSERQDRFLRSRGWFYSVFSFMLHIDGLIREDGTRSDSHESSRPSEEKARRLSDLRTELVASYAHTLKTDSNLARSVSGAASDRRSRISRFDFVRKASQKAWGTSAASPMNRSSE